MLRRLLLLSFIEGAAVMAAELCGARLLAPIFGGSLYVWASVMAFTLVALAAGYFFGGRWSAHIDKLNLRLRLLLSLAALFLIAMPILAFYLVPRISYLPFLPGMILSTVVVLVPSVFLLGASSPLFIRLQSHSTDQVGQVSGTVYAVSTTGGIIATFLCGFYLIPVLGLQSTLLMFGLLLFCSTALAFKSVKGWEVLILLLALYMHVQLWQMRQERLLASDGIMGQIEVRDEVREGSSIRVLAINQIIQSEMDLDSKESVSPYLNLVRELIPHTSQSKKALVLGLGGGLSAGLLQRKGYAVTGVEFDARILDAAKDYFFLSDKVRAIDEDARLYLNGCQEKFALVLVDVFRAEEQPSHVFTLESLSALKKNLNDSALVCISWHGYIEGSRGEGTHVLLNTLKAAGFKTKISTSGDQEDTRNLIILASLRKLKQFPHEIEVPASNVIAMNTDNSPQLERSNALANKSWRSLYLRYYQQKN